MTDETKIQIHQVKGMMKNSQEWTMLMVMLPLFYLKDIIKKFVEKIGLPSNLIRTELKSFPFLMVKSRYLFRRYSWTIKVSKYGYTVLDQGKYID